MVYGLVFLGRGVDLKTNFWVQQALYNLVLNLPRVIQSPVANDCLKLPIGGQTEKHILLNMLFQVSVRELYGSMLIPSY